MVNSKLSSSNIDRPSDAIKSASDIIVRIQNHDPPYQSTPDLLS